MKKTEGQREPRISGAAGAPFVALAWLVIRRHPPWVEAYERPSRAARLLSEHDHACLLGNRRRP